MIEAGSVIAMGTVGATYRSGGKTTSTTPKNQQQTKAAPSQNSKPAVQQEAATNPQTASNVEAQPKVNSGVADATKNRVKLRKGTMEKIKENQPRNDKGEMLDPNTNQPLQPGKTDVGHKPGNEWWRRKEMHQKKGSTRKEVVEAENDPTLYQLEDRSSNRSHKHEKKGN